MRLVWHEMLVRALSERRQLVEASARDGKRPALAPLPNVAPAVAILIGSHFDNNTAETFVGQDTIAKELGISPRLVWASIAGYRDRGLLLVRHGGRKSNYMAMP